MTVTDWQRQLGKLDHPVVCVSWHDAVAYAAWLAQVTGQAWRLLTEAEWEKAARWDPVTRHSRIYPWGDAFDQSRCNTSGRVKGGTTPVGTYPTGASPCGAQDMAGNVEEWTSSVFKPYPYDSGDGREALDAPEGRVLRGGTFGELYRPAGLPEFVRAARRPYLYPDLFADWAGFRVARAPREGR